MSPDEAAVFTPCHGAQVVLTPDTAVVDASVDPVCPTCGRRWVVTLKADPTAECGLRAVWTADEEAR